MFELIHRQSSLFFVSYIINSMNNWTFKFIAPLALYVETQSLQMMTVCYGLLFTPNIIAPPLINLIDGKLAKKTCLLILNTFGLSICVFAFLHFKNGSSGTVFLIIILMLSTVLTLFQTLIHSLIKDVFTDNNKIEIAGRRIAFVDSLFPAVGPLIGANLLRLFNYSHAFLLIGVAYFLSFLLVNLLQVNEKRTVSNGGFLARSAKGFKLIRHSPFINFLLTRFFLSNIALHGFQSVLTFYLIDKFHLADIKLGFFFAISALGLLIGLKIGRFIYAHNVNKWYVISVTGIIGACNLIITPLTNCIFIVALAWSIVMLLSAINLIIFYTERQINFQRDDTASVIAASYVIIYSAIPLGSVVSFMLSQYCNASETLFIFGIYMLVIGFYFLYTSIRNQRVLKQEK